ncbi:uncharacterized protein LOC132699500 [Cylas formicarius]|uniref:uncharacterized protein LOC132699500 n=1 Tax=Cylas formicarius TaxID=197179 RepID=UPI00295877ED|nr:uncharacterized protein LOC132699500 [Cylas formicarius]
MRCSLKCCENNKRKTKNSSVLYFHLPDDLYFQKLWLKKCSRKVVYKQEKFVLCSSHFSEDDFDLVNGTQVLKLEAVPSINLPEDIYQRENKGFHDFDLSNLHIPETESTPHTFIEGTEESEVGLVHKYRLLLLEYELMLDKVKNQEATLEALKNENSALNALLASQNNATQTG